MQPPEKMTSCLQNQLLAHTFGEIEHDKQCICLRLKKFLINTFKK